MGWRLDGGSITSKKALKSVQKHVATTGPTHKEQGSRSSRAMSLCGVAGLKNVSSQMRTNMCVSCPSHRVITCARVTYLSRVFICLQPTHAEFCMTWKNQVVVCCASDIDRHLCWWVYAMAEGIQSDQHQSIGELYQVHDVCYISCVYSRSKRMRGCWRRYHLQRNADSIK